MDNQQLITLALKAREKAYAPYSHFAVGAAVLTKGGLVYTGCNIENASYGATNCAERTAVFKAVSEGKREYTAIAVVGGPEGKMPDGNSVCSPCGVCRQVLREFCDTETFRVYMTDGSKLISATLEELLPVSFGPANL